MPEGLGNVWCIPALFAELARGYGDGGLGKIAGRNLLGLMRAAEEVAARLAAR